MDSTRDFEAASDRYADQSVPVTPAGPALAGNAAAAAGRDFLIAEYGSLAAVNTEMKRGRPRVGDTRQGPSPSVRTRLPETDYAAFKALEESTGRKQSELLREAVHNLLVQHKLVN
jgi:hypothetical protein